MLFVKGLMDTRLFRQTDHCKKHIVLNNVYICISKGALAVILMVE